MYKIGIIDDELFFRDLLYNKVKTQFQNAEISTFSDAESFLDASIYFDIMLIDIKLRNIDGITLSKKIKNRCGLIIFISSMENKVYDAFGINIFAFIPKKEIEKKINSYLSEAIKVIQNQEKISLNTNLGTFSYRLNDIYLIRKENRKIYMYLENNVVQLNGYTLSSLFSILNENFVYCDKPCIINVKQIKSFEKHAIVLNNLLSVNVSRYKYKSVKFAFLGAF